MSENKTSEPKTKYTISPINPTEAQWETINKLTAKNTGWTGNIGWYSNGTCTIKFEKETGIAHIAIDMFGNVTSEQWYDK